MEIKYTRTYTPPKGKRYTAGEITALLGYALEIAEPRVKLKEGKLAPGEVCLLLFAITPEEYALKDGDPKSLDALANRLAKSVPADRLLAWRIMDLKGANIAKSVQVETGETIDDGELMRRVRERAAKAQAGPIDAQLIAAARLQKSAAEKDASDETRQSWLEARRNLGAALMNLEKTWVAMDALTGDRWPSIGFDGRVEIFTTIERAHRVQAQITSAHAGVQTWTLKPFSREELQTLLTNCAADGLELLRIDNGFAASQLGVKDCVVYGLEANAVLRSMLLREIQYGMRYARLKEIQAPEKNLRGALESTLSLKNFIRRETGNASLWALCPGADRSKCVVLSGKDVPQRLLAVFTTANRAKAFAQKLNPTIRPVEMKFDEIAQRCENAEGLLIDAGSIGYRLPKAEFAQVMDLRTKPPVMVRVQPREDAAPAAPAQPQPTRQESLPNPDDFAPVKIEGPAHTPANPPENDHDPAPQPPRKGILKKFFGK